MKLARRTTLILLVSAIAALPLAGCGPSAPKPTGVTPPAKATSDTAAEKINLPVDKPKTETIEPAPEVKKPVEPAPEKPGPEKPSAEPAKEPAKETPPPVPAPEPAKEAKKSNKVLLGSPELTAGIAGDGPLKAKELDAWLADPANHETLEVELPLGLAAGAGAIKGLDKNPLTRAKIELGRQLYFDNRLSADVSLSCANCHSPEEGYAAHSQFGIGIRKQLGGRNSPVSYNRILSDKQFWDGRADSLEAQAIGPIANPIEMGHTHEACVECLKKVDGYKKQFDKIFGEFNIDAIGKAIASFERTLVTGPSAFDHNEVLAPLEKLDKDDIDENPALKAKYETAVTNAKAKPMSDSAKRGKELFFGQKAGCTACHVGPNFSDEKYHNLGVGMDKPEPDLGRFTVTNDEKEKGAFKTPTIRNVALSAPYMHDGSQKTLAEVVEWYAKGGHPNPSLSDKIKKLDLTDQDKKDLVEFMLACTGDFPKVQRGRLPE